MATLCLTTHINCCCHYVSGHRWNFLFHVVQPAARALCYDGSRPSAHQPRNLVCARPSYVLMMLPELDDRHRMFCSLHCHVCDVLDIVGALGKASTGISSLDVRCDGAISFCSDDQALVVGWQDV